MKSSIFAPLKHRDYRKLFFGQLFSDIGSWFDFLALQALIVFTWHLGPGANAAQIIAFAIPWVIIGPFAGVWADRLPKRTLMIICDLLRAAVAFSLIFVPNFYLLLALVFLKSTISSVFDPARQGAIRMTVPEDELLQAVSLSQLVNNATKVIGPLLGASVVAIGGVRAPFVIELVCFLLSALFLSRLPALRNEPRKEETTDTSEKLGFWGEFREGWQHIRSSRMLYVSIILSVGYMFITFFYDGQISQWANAIGGDVTTYGIIVSAIGLGSVLGAFAVGHFTSWKNNPLQFMAVAGVMSGCFLVVMGLGGRGDLQLPLATWWVICFLWGSLSAGAFIPFGYIQQSETPKQLMGRVSSVSNAMMSLNMVIAPIIGSSLMHTIGVGTVFGLAGVLLVLFTGTSLFFVRRANVLPSGVLKERNTVL